MFWLNKIVWWVANPYQVGIAGAIVGFCLAVSRGKRCASFGRWLTGLSLLWVYVWSSGWLFTDTFDELAERYPPKLAAEYPEADAIADLGGGVGINTNIAFYADMNYEADRAWLAAELWKAGKAPVVIPSAKDAAVADRQLLMALGVPESAIVMENEARNTEENAKFIQATVKSLVREGGLPSSNARPRVLVVTSLTHMRRAMLMFERYAPDIEAIPAATDYGQAGSPGEAWWGRMMPTADHLGYNCKMLHEWLGYWGYRLFRK